MYGARDLEKLEKNLKKHHEKLLNVNRRNRSVLLRRIYTKYNFDLDELDGGISGRVLKAALRAEYSGQINMLRDSLEGDDTDVMRGKLRRLASNLSQIEVETGRQTNYVGFPFVEGHANPDFYVRGPLVLFPVHLERRRLPKNGGWYLVFTGQPPIYNSALVSTIKKMAEREIPGDIEERFANVVDTMLEYKGNDPVGEFVRLASDWARDMLGIDKMGDLNPGRMGALTKPDIEDMGRRPLSIVGHRILGSFPQADSEIYADYGRLRGIHVIGDLGPMADLLEMHGGDPPDLPEIDLDRTPDRELNTVLDSDSSQDRVILESKRSRLVVVRGPPGTGKSQVITNMITDALSNGKKVLVVCQKRAALEVVQRRLRHVGLKRFSVMLDRESIDRRKMYEQILNVMQDPDDRLSGEASTPDQLSAEIDQKILKLAELENALHTEYFGGATAHRIYSTMDGGYTTRLDLRGAGFEMKWGELGPCIEKFGRLERSYKRFDAPGAPWQGRTDFSVLGIAKKSEISDLLEELGSGLDGAMLASSGEMQGHILDNLRTYVKNPGFLGRRRRPAAENIASALGRASVDRRFVEGMMPRVQAGARVWGKMPDLLALFGEDGRARVTGEAASGGLERLISEMTKAMGSFEEIQSYDMQKKEAGRMVGLAMDLCGRGMDPGEDWAAKLRNEILAMWLDIIEEENLVLRLDPADLHRENSEALAVLLERKKAAIQDAISSRIIGSMAGGGHSWTGLKAELKRKRKVKPVRELFQTYSEQLLLISPCWLASPESVSKVFPLERGLFDLVIVDEASQLPVEKALPFIYRAKSVVIAGDEKQLQPFDLFQIRDDEDEDHDEDVSDERSLFDTARVVHEPIQLAWHYRSRHQDLIDFSNHAFYGGTLRIAPNVVIRPEQPPIRWVRCDGVWDGRCNDAEADEVLEIIRRIWLGSPSEPPSIGVITFNDAQRDLIEERFERRLDDNPAFRLLYEKATDGRGVDDKPFIKNIENVQGDERDIIIFSIGYARKPDGKFSNIFGTLNKAGGENRLNVAVTRAREQMIVVCSIEPGDIKETSKNLGPRRLRQFLEYSRAVSDSSERGAKEVLQRLGDAMQVDGDRDGATESPFEEQVLRELEGRGYKVHPQVGYSGFRIDLGVVHPDDPSRYVAGIECDGATYHRAKGAKERDVMRQRFLEHKGWRILRIWSRRWWNNREAETDRIVDRIEEFRRSG